MDKQKGIIRVSFEKLAELIDLHKDNTIDFIIYDTRQKDINAIDIVVSGPKMVQVPEGHAMMITHLRTDGL